MTFSMCLPHLHPFWVNQKKTKRRKSAGKKCAIHSKVKTGEASCVPTLRIALMRAVHGRMSCFRKRNSNFWARKGREGTWDQSACSPAKAFPRDPARAFSFWPRDIPKALFLYRESVPLGWVDETATICLTLLLKKIQTFKGKVSHFCFHRWFKPQL